MIRLTAKDIMNSQVISVPADWSVQELAQFLTEKAITGAPVADETGKLIGVVSATDIVRFDSFCEKPIRANEPHDYYMHGWEQKLSADDLSSFHIEDFPEASVREIMTPLIFKVDVNTPVQEIAYAMIGGRIHRLLVLDHGSIVGIITTMDMLKVIRRL